MGFMKNFTPLTYTQFCLLYDKATKAKDHEKLDNLDALYPDHSKTYWLRESIAFPSYNPEWERD